MIHTLWWMLNSSKFQAIYNALVFTRNTP